MIDLGEVSAIISTDRGILITFKNPIETNSHLLHVKPNVKLDIKFPDSISSGDVKEAESSIKKAVQVLSTIYPCGE